MEKRPRWEIKYEKYKTEGRKEYIKTVTEIEKLKNQKISASTVEEFQEIKKNQEIEINEKMKQVNEYENFKKNERKIDNIYEYRKELEKRLAQLPIDTRKQLENANNEKQDLFQRVVIYQKDIENIKKLKEQATNEEHKKLFDIVLKERMEQMGNFQKRQSELDREMIELEQSGRNFDEKAESQKIMLERKIAKCNIIAANLLKGKDIGEFDLRTNNEKYTDKNDNMQKQIEASKQAEELQNDIDKDDNIQKQIEESKETEKLQKDTDTTNNIREAQATEIQPIQEGAITKIEKYPRIAKIMNFFKNLKEKITSRFTKKEKVNDEIKNTVEEDFYEKYNKILEKRKEEQKKLTESELQKEENSKSVEEITENKLQKEENSKSVEEITENKLLLEIAEKGKDKTFRDRLRVAKQNAANEYAQKYGGQYRNQDGAKQNNDREIE